MHLIPAVKTHEWLKTVDADFVAYVNAQSPELVAVLGAYRQNQHDWSEGQVSQFLIQLAPLLEGFIAMKFGINAEVEQHQASRLQHQPVLAFKKSIVQKAKKRPLTELTAVRKFADLHQWLMDQVSPTNVDLELAVARLAQQWQADSDQVALNQLSDWCLHAWHTATAQALVADWVCFQWPSKINHQALVPLKPVAAAEPPIQQGVGAARHRVDFKLTDTGMDARALQAQADYCIYCHKNQGDFCRRGFPVKKSDPSQGLKKNPLGEILTGCPLDERISEMQLLAQQGHSIAPLAVIMIDNPLCPATGHRICNDCMKSCIYQKQTPVDIPQIETGVLNAVLALPWGVEVYDLLLNWNPLRAAGFVLAQPHGDRVMIMGMGPAGFTMANQLLMAGYTVVGMDGLKIEPTDPEQYQQLVQSFDAISAALDVRTVKGFGGVAEYGITARWNKNYLSLILLSLLRRQQFLLFGGVRFGGSIEVEDAWSLGFDHLVLAVGAGLPKALSIPGSLAPGVRAANDFLMALQLSGAHQAESLSGLSVELPAVVIGSGLTGVDAATEVQTYYLLQIKRVARRYQQLSDQMGEVTLRAQLSVQQQVTLDRWLMHAQALTLEQQKPSPDIVGLLHTWGGVTVVYRKHLQNSPAYQRNHEELIKALEEGILYAPCFAPTAIMCDDTGQCKALSVVRTEQDAQGQWQLTDQAASFPARCVLVATGAQPNVAYGFEHAGTFERKRYQYTPYYWADGSLKPAPTPDHCKTPLIGMFTSYQAPGRCVSFIGDTHPTFHGSVVKAMASAMRAMPLIDAQLKQHRSTRTQPKDSSGFLEMCQTFFAAVIKEKKALNAHKVLLSIHAPHVVKRFLPGHFVRVQTFETQVASIKDVRLHSEGVALPILSVDVKSQTLQVVLSLCSVSERLLALVQPGQRVSVMGPTGVRAKIPDQPGTILLMVEPHLIPNACVLGRALRAAGHGVWMVVYLQQADALYLRPTLEMAADVIFWQLTEGKLANVRDQDHLMYEAVWPELLNWMQLPAQKKQAGLLTDVRILTSAERMAQIKSVLPELTQATRVAVTRCVATVYGPMQCMLKGVCAQCLQWQIDPVSGARTKAVYACSWQDQPMELVDIEHLAMRHQQVGVLEKLNSLTVDVLLDKQA